MESETIVLGGGCFWCTEAIFKMLKGVATIAPGYAGGTKPFPTYEQVSKGDSGYVEVVRIEYNPALTSFHDILTVFFATHDATTLNRQGNDVGPQYRSVIFYTLPKQQKEAEAFIQTLNASTKDGASIVTEVAPLTTFYNAENYHKNYYESHKDDMYCRVVISPKLDKVQREFASMLKSV